MNCNFTSRSKARFLAPTVHLRDISQILNRLLSKLRYSLGSGRVRHYATLSWPSTLSISRRRIAFIHPALITGAIRLEPSEHILVDLGLRFCMSQFEYRWVPCGGYTKRLIIRDRKICKLQLQGLQHIPTQLGQEGFQAVLTNPHTPQTTPTSARVPNPRFRRGNLCADLN
jgi:hypothetical protein